MGIATLKPTPPAPSYDFVCAGFCRTSSGLCCGLPAVEAHGSNGPFRPCLPALPGAERWTLPLPESMTLTPLISTPLIWLFPMPRIASGIYESRVGCGGVLVGGDLSANAAGPWASRGFPRSASAVLRRGASRAACPGRFDASTWERS